MSPAAGEAVPMFRYETHMHTSEVSRCAHATARDMILACQRQGYDGAVITDHFLQGNSHANIPAPWPQRVSILMEGYRRAQGRWGCHRADRISGLGGHARWARSADLRAGRGFPAGKSRSLPANLRSLLPPAYAQAGGFVSQAHPYREAFYVPARARLILLSGRSGGL